jgi:hypothetical protein
MIRRIGRIDSKSTSLYLITFCIAISFWTAAYPFSRAFLKTQITYNEGWNAYNAMKVAEHQPLYPTAYGWTSVNYPALSFHLIAALGRFPSNYLFTGRFLSLAGLCLSGLMAGLIVWQITRAKLAAGLSGLFLVAVFCANAKGYVGMDDPQMLAQFFFMAGLYVYLKGNRSGWALEFTALLFVVGGNIKHSLIEFPLAVLLDLLFTSPRKALRYAFAGTLMAVISVVLTIRIDGSAYISPLLASRGYSWKGAILQACDVLLPILPFALVALWMARYCWKIPAQRVLALLLFCALPLNTYFSGGSGVTINSMFGSMLAIVLLVGVFLGEFFKLPRGRLKSVAPPVVIAAFFLWLAVPMVIAGDPLIISATIYPSHIDYSGNWRTDLALERSLAGRQRFSEEVTFLRQQPGPALCESLLRCYYGGKPYLYDPFDATRFLALGKLDANVMVSRLQNHEFGAVQMSSSVEEKLGGRWPDSHFAPPILRAIQQYYSPGFTNEDGIIYIPKIQEPIKKS